MHLESREVIYKAARETMQAFCLTESSFLVVTRSSLPCLLSFTAIRRSANLKYPCYFRSIRCSRSTLVSAVKRSERVNRDDEAFATCPACGSDELVSAGKLFKNGSVRVRCSQCQHQWLAELSTALTIDGSSLAESQLVSSSPKNADQRKNTTSEGSAYKSDLRIRSQLTSSDDTGVRLHVSGLGSKVDNALLRQMFEVYGRVQEAIVICDRASSRSRGFGFVVMAGESAASAAIDDLSGRLSYGRRLTVRKTAE